MKVWVDSLLTSTGAPLKKEYLKTPTLVVDFRKNQQEKKWYEQNAIFLEIDNVYYDEGRAVKDKDKCIKELCKKIVSHMNAGEQVLLVCYDGMTICGYIAIICRWWYMCENDIMEKDFDYLKDVRDGNDFTSAKTKEQREQMEQVKKYACQMMLWKEQGFQNKKRERE